MSSELIKLYDEMSTLTKPLCGQCRVPHSCCHEFYCEIAIEYAKEKGIELQKTEHPKLPLMGPSGCTCPPHLRPSCTLHVCSMGSIGILTNPDQTINKKLTKEYFKLRNKIAKLEYEEHLKA